jgi:hypothetical protein
LKDIAKPRTWAKQSHHTSKVFVTPQKMDLFAVLNSPEGGLRLSRLRKERKFHSKLQNAKGIEHGVIWDFGLRILDLVIRELEN